MLLVHRVLFFNFVVEGCTIDFVHRCALVLTLMVSLNLLIKLVPHETLGLHHLLSVSVLIILPLVFLLFQTLPLDLSFTALDLSSLLVYHSLLT